MTSVKKLSKNCLYKGLKYNSQKIIEAELKTFG